MAHDDGAGLTGGKLTVDVVLFTRLDSTLSVLVIKRRTEPFRSAWALPGGFVKPDERTPDAAVRELAEETGIEFRRNRLRRLGFYDQPGRDPRGQIASVVYHGYVANGRTVLGASDARSARWISVVELLASGTPVAFDHREIVADATRRRFGALPDPPARAPPRAPAGGPLLAKTALDGMPALGYVPRVTGLFH